MLNRNALGAVLALGLLALFVAGVVQLFRLRLQTGDVYPACSSLRADPLGGRAFYDSLTELPRVEVSRHYRSLKRLEGTGAFTFFYTGIPVEAAWGADEIVDLEKLLAQGMRLVLTWAPVTEIPQDERPGAKARLEETFRKEREAKEDAAGKKNDDPGKETSEENDERSLSMRAFAEHWGFGLGYLSAPGGEPAEIETLRATRQAGETENTLEWRTLLVFEKPSSDWRVLYECRGRPVIIERSFGTGSIVCCADSYFLSNEALRKHRAPQLLAALTGGSARVVFDELHHGVSERPGIMMLARRHGLGAFLAALVVVALLFVWQNASPLVPPHAATQRAGADVDMVTGRESFAGFVNLLRRHIPPRDLLGACWEAWQGSFAHRRARARDGNDRMARAEAIVAGARRGQGREVLNAYREISRILSEKKPGTPPQPQPPPSPSPSP